MLALTGYPAFAATPERALRAGCDVMLLKPYSPEDLQVAIRNLMDYRQPKRA
ncbi:MAG: hypothetical protein LC804_24855 [Acidobacteria bacterium]|nr:hypothetical protein [Acidobacteriota bacterium]